MVRKHRDQRKTDNPASFIVRVNGRVTGQSHSMEQLIMSVILSRESLAKAHAPSRVESANTSLLHTHMYTNGNGIDCHCVGCALILYVWESRHSWLLVTCSTTWLCLFTFVLFLSVVTDVWRSLQPSQYHWLSQHNHRTAWTSARPCIKATRYTARYIYTWNHTPVQRLFKRAGSRAQGAGAGSSILARLLAGGAGFFTT